jgi:hypothetical protein
MYVSGNEMAVSLNLHRYNTEKLIEQCTSKLLMEFGEWFAEQFGDAAADSLEAGGGVVVVTPRCQIGHITWTTPARLSSMEPCFDCKMTWCAVPTLAGGVSAGGGVRLSRAAGAGGSGGAGRASSDDDEGPLRPGAAAAMAAAGVTTGDDTDAAAAFYNAQSTLRAGKRSAGTTGTPQRRAQGGSRKAF